ncbi:GtrA family protein [Herbiconiux sp. YIM B11900]|uniref:GtrA family protein n=1 Tax=Herbiconiux sp. YIM B11900 TaxID=3404131 RepID=UPI003F84B2BE
MADRRGLLGSVLKFGLVGGLTVLIDAAVYALLGALGVQLDLAKTISFVTGAVFAYFANWRFTFGRRRGRFSELVFVVIYAASLGINVGINALVRLLLPESWALTLPLAFVVATGASAAWNFVGMSLFVFQRPEAAVAASAPPAGRTPPRSDP